MVPLEAFRIIPKEEWEEISADNPPRGGNKPRPTPERKIVEEIVEHDEAAVLKYPTREEAHRKGGYIRSFGSVRVITNKEDPSELIVGPR